jgi:hypothetical protein
MMYESRTKYQTRDYSCTRDGSWRKSCLGRFVVELGCVEVMIMSINRFIVKTSITSTAQAIATRLVVLLSPHCKAV